MANSTVSYPTYLHPFRATSVAEADKTPTPTRRADSPTDPTPIADKPAETKYADADAPAWSAELRSGLACGSSIIRAHDDAR